MCASASLRSMTFGNGQTETQTWNHRLQATGISRGSAFSLTYAYCASVASCQTNNGNVVSQTIGHAASAVQTYGYDTLGRLATATEGSTWSRSFDADQWGNSWVTANSGVTLASFTPVGSSNFDANNRLQIQGSNYDLAGNQIVIGGYTFAYDGENRLAQSTLGGESASYSYDGEGRRVKKVNRSRTVVYVYGVGGNLIQEYDTATPVASTWCRTCWAARAWCSAPPGPQSAAWTTCPSANRSRKAWEWDAAEPAGQVPTNRGRSLPGRNGMRKRA